MKLKATNILASLFVCFSLTGQSIVGTVSDCASGQLLNGATVKILQTGSVAATDNEGRYAFDNLKSGDYTLEFSYIGMKSVKREASTGKRIDVCMEGVPSTLG
ncbi:MAG: carboxypeptidase-like regulatory domain-containing protein, partial [Dysgonamonadaceae bacterium]|nr:carboxypeptidase-like regulatory domain-containing protein [Dysgonamonadaceae bacterium]